MSGKFVEISKEDIWWEVEEYFYCIVNLYAPNEDTPSIFREILQHVNELECTHIIVGELVCSETEYLLQ